MKYLSALKYVCISLAMAIMLAGVAIAAPNFPGDENSWDANDTPRSIYIIGDSFVGQSAATAIAIGEQRAHTVNAKAYSGGAPCDSFVNYGSTTAAINPQHVVFAFVGNATSDCMRRELGWSPDCCLTSGEVSAIVSAYRKYLTTMIRWNQGRNITTWLVASPQIANGTWHNQITAQLNTMLADLAADEGLVGYSTAARNLVSPGGVYSSNVGGLRYRHADSTHLAAPYGTTAHATGLLAGPMTGN